MLGDVDLFLDLVETVHRNIASLVEAVRDFKRVNSLVKKLLGLLEDGSGKHDNTRGAVADLVVLGGRELDEEFGSLMMDLKVLAFKCTYLHFLENCGAIIGDDDFAIGRHEHLVHALGTERGLEEGGNGPGSQDVDLVGLKALDSLLLTLFTEDDEGAS